MRLSRLPGAVILRLMSSLLCEHYRGCTCHNRRGFVRFAIEVTADQKSRRGPPVNEISSISGDIWRAGVFLSPDAKKLCQFPRETFLQA